MFSESSSIFAAAVITLGLINSVQSASLILYESLTNQTRVPLNESQQLFESINTSRCIIFYAHGYKGLRDGPETITMLSAYLHMKVCKVIFVEWEKEASNQSLSDIFGYSIAASNAKKVGEALALEIVKLVGLGLKLVLIHFIGFSLGAHLMGYMGCKARALGLILLRITGLDPARLLFEPPLLLNTPINPLCAEFVDVHHSDQGGCGMNDRTGTFDFYYNRQNYLGTDKRQPGCEPGFELCGNMCSHRRIVYYWAESLKNNTGFIAGIASSFAEFVAANGNFDSSSRIYVGNLTNTDATGLGFLSTYSSSPFAMGEAGLNAP